MRLPNFVIIGAAKAGTTSLYHYLKQHPQVFMSEVKEPRFFAYEGDRLAYTGPGDLAKADRFVTTLEQYAALFADAGDARAVGEASPIYMHSEKACRRMRHYVPDARLLAILRHPVERAYSNFLHMRRDGREPLREFAAAVREEPRRRAAGWAPFWFYMERGRYHEQLQRYYAAFGRERLHVLLHEDLLRNGAAGVRRCYEVLGVDPEFQPDLSRRFNTARVPRSRGLHLLLTRPGPLPKLLGKRLTRHLVERNLERLPFPEELRPELTEYFREDILRTGDLIGRDLSHWLRGDRAR